MIGATDQCDHKNIKVPSLFARFRSAPGRDLGRGFLETCGQVGNVLVRSRALRTLHAYYLLPST
jgi:hypothetical protein